MRYVVKRKPGIADAGELDRVAAMPGIEIIDRIGNQAALVEAGDNHAERLKQALPDWSFAPESGVARPAPPFPRPAWKLG